MLENTTFADFGDPINSTSYTFTITDESGGVPTVVFSAVIPAGGTCGKRPCWKRIGRATNPKGFAYRDRAGTNGGITKIRMKIHPGNLATLGVYGKGLNLALPALPLNQDPRVGARLFNSIGEVFEILYTPPANRNDSAKFKDRRDAF
jgi:hypothetical protein